MNVSAFTFSSSSASEQVVMEAIDNRDAGGVLQALWDIGDFACPQRWVQRGALASRACGDGARAEFISPSSLEGGRQPLQRGVTSSRPSPGLQTWTPDTCRGCLHAIALLCLAPLPSRTFAELFPTPSGRGMPASFDLCCGSSCAWSPWRVRTLAVGSVLASVPHRQPGSRLLVSRNSPRGHAKISRHQRDGTGSKQRLHRATRSCPNIADILLTNLTKTDSRVGTVRPLPQQITTSHHTPAKIEPTQFSSTMEG